MAPDAPDERLELDDFLRRPEWHKRGACRGQGTRAFFAKGTAPASTRAICAGCPVRQECLEVALADDELQGVWGGTTESERRGMRRSVA